MQLKKLYILRHAKAESHSLSAEGDHGRVLSERGRADALRLGEYLHGKEIAPQRVICSSSSRTRETLKLVMQGAKAQWDTEFSKRLYLASPKDALQVIAEVSDATGSLMIIGHNPTLHQLCLDLAAEGEAEGLQLMSERFPTGTLATIEYPAEHWSELGAKKGTLRHLVTPKLIHPCERV